MTSADCGVKVADMMMEIRHHGTPSEAPFNVPFIMTQARNGAFHPIWTECFCGYRSDDRSDAVSNAAYWGKLMPNQNLDEWGMIDQCSECKGPRTSMIGLLELLRAGVLNEGDAGEAYLLQDRFGRLGVWADSEGAAKRYLKEPTERVANCLKGLGCQT